MKQYKTKPPAVQPKMETPFFGKGGGFFSSAPRPIIQRDIGQSIPVADGTFDIDMRSQEGAKATPPTSSAGEVGTIAFDPAITAPYSNEIRLIQIIRDRDTAGQDVDILSMPAGRGKSLRTTAGLGTKVEPGFATDVLHQNFDNAGNPTTVTPQGDPKGMAYEGGTPTVGFKRSDDPKDIKAARLHDSPTASQDLDYKFETVAKGEDTGVIYGSLLWSFGTRSGRVVNEKVDAKDAESTTFDAALEKHRNFYVHEPVVLYFDYNKDTFDATETAKIDGVLDYLHRFPDVHLSLQGYTDIRGDAAYNSTLVGKRIDNVRAALIAKKIDPTRIEDFTVGNANSTNFTAGGLAPNPGRSQNLEANRRGNRRVVVTFSHTASYTPP